jgi:molybdopterin/thiamine biosynthesis adenylyltransferase
MLFPAESSMHIPVDLSQNEVARYSRHLIMPEVGVEGQKRLKALSDLRCVS